MATEMLKAKAISKAFQGHPALKDVELTLRAGEVHSLMGENGAGKSTLIKILAGIYQPDSGSIELQGEIIQPKSNHHAQELGISTVFQEVNLISTLSVAENIYLGREPLKFGQRIDWKKMRQGARIALERLDLKIDVEAPLENFSIAIQQMVAIARALDQSARVLILDEATSSLDRDEVQRLFKVLKQLRAEGLAILFVSHFLDQVYEISDRITIFRNGGLIGEYLVSELKRVDLVSKMMGRELSSVENEIKTDPLIRAADLPWLECQDLGHKGHIEPFDLKIKGGQTVGLAGLLGSGRTEIANLLFGLEKKTSGEIKVKGQNLKLKNPREAVAQGFALCPEDRKTQSIFPQLSVRENIILALQARQGWIKSISTEKQNKLAQHYIEALGIKTRDAEQPIETLSGGNQQKAILARWLATDPRLLILDEPTRGVDVGAKAEIQKYISQFSNSEKSVLFISSELEEVVRLCDEVSVLKDHRKISELNREQITETAIMSAIGEAT